LIANRFPKEVRLRSSKDFRRLRALGQKRHTPHFVVYWQRKSDGPTRLGLTVSRKVGGAVTRNRIKRLVREVFRLKYQDLPDHTDFSIIAKKNAGELTFDQILRELLVLTSQKSRSGSTIEKS